MGRQAATTTPVLVCDACRYHAGPDEIHRIDYEGQDLRVCRDTVACRRRAQHAGIYGGRE